MARGIRKDVIALHLSEIIAKVMLGPAIAHLMERGAYRTLIHIFFDKCPPGIAIAATVKLLEWGRQNELASVARGARESRGSIARHIGLSASSEIFKRVYGHDGLNRTAVDGLFRRALLTNGSFRIAEDLIEQGFLPSGKVLNEALKANSNGFHGPDLPNRVRALEEMVAQRVRAGLSAAKVNRLTLDAVTHSEWRMLVEESILLGRAPLPATIAKASTLAGRTGDDAGLWISSLPAKVDAARLATRMARTRPAKQGAKIDAGL